MHWQCCAVCSRAVLSDTFDDNRLGRYIRVKRQKQTVFLQCAYVCAFEMVCGCICVHILGSTRLLFQTIHSTKALTGDPSDTIMSLKRKLASINNLEVNNRANDSTLHMHLIIILCRLTATIHIVRTA